MRLQRTFARGLIWFLLTEAAAVRHSGGVWLHAAYRRKAREQAVQMRRLRTVRAAAAGVDELVSTSFSRDSNEIVHQLLQG